MRARVRWRFTAAARRAGSASVRPAAARKGSRCGRRASKSSWERYWEFIQSSFSRSKTAGESFRRSTLKRRDHLVAREDLAVVARAPAEERQEVVERLRQDPLVAELLDGGRRRSAWRGASCPARGSAAGGRRSAPSPPSAWKSGTCLGVFERWSSPRMTWVMRHVDVVARPRTCGRSGCRPSAGG